MQQMDLFEETLAKKINRMERWIYRLQKEMMFLKNVYDLNERNKRKIDEIPYQRDMFVG